MFIFCGKMHKKSSKKQVINLFYTSSTKPQRHLYAAALSQNQHFYCIALNCTSHPPSIKR